MEIFPAVSREEWLGECERQDALRRHAILRTAAEFQDLGYAFYLRPAGRAQHLIIISPHGELTLAHVPVLYEEGDEFHHEFFLQEALHHLIKSPEGRRWGAVRPEEFMHVVWEEALRNPES